MSDVRMIHKDYLVEKLLPCGHPAACACDEWNNCGWCAEVGMGVEHYKSVCAERDKLAAELAESEDDLATVKRVLKEVSDRTLVLTRERNKAEGELADSRKIQTAEKLILIAEIEKATKLHAELTAARERIKALEALINTPETEDFDKAIPLEAAHQIERWSAEHDAGKTPADWFWLVGYLAGKALAAHIVGNIEKAKHHCVSTAAALRNWHAHIRSGESKMRPGHSPFSEDAKT